jgi:hypothetical protein
MGDTFPGRPTVNKLFLGAQKLARGQTLYLMCSVEAAEWLCQDDVKQGFVDHYGTPILVRNNGYPLIMEYVLVAFNPNPHTISVLKILNELGANAISEARYLKDPTKRALNQKMAFLHMTFRSSKTTNRVIQDGLIIEGKKVCGRKEIPEAWRCLKCQGLTHRHIASNCPQIHNSCAVCGEMHRTSECSSGNTRAYCVNCQTEGHTASSCNCPIFIAECEKIKFHFPENKYRFFPIIDDPSTWQLLKSLQDSPILLVPQPPPACNQGMSQNPGRAWNRGPRQSQTRGTNRQRCRPSRLRRTES